MIENPGKAMKSNNDADFTGFCDGFQDSYKALEQMYFYRNKRINIQDKLEVWSLYMQATKGDFKGKGLWNGKEKAMWDAWNLQTGKSKEDAQIEFITLAQKIINDMEYSNYQEPTLITSRTSFNLENYSQKDKNNGDKGNQDSKKRIAAIEFKKSKPNDDDVETMI